MVAGETIRDGLGCCYALTLAHRLSLLHPEGRNFLFLFMHLLFEVSGKLLEKRTVMGGRQ
jgi:hypothetical protein